MDLHKISTLKIIQKIRDKEDLSEEEIEYFIKKYEVHRSYGNKRRWTSAVTSTCVVGLDIIFQVDWVEGLKEGVKNSYMQQPRLVNNGGIRLNED